MHQVFVIFVAEFIGTFLLVFLGCAGCIPIKFIPESLLMSFSFGFAVLIIVQVIQSS
jgi:glycerol uptake facilitator-like aquaporin